MAPRLSLQTLLKDLLGSDQVYFQAPPANKVSYPAIIYTRNDERVDHADNLPYNRRVRYEVKIIDPNPDSEFNEKVAALPLCAFDRFYTADNLNHNVYQLFF